jgi:hypothetical protein
MGPTESDSSDTLVEELRLAIFFFAEVRQRYPLLRTTAAEMERLRKRTDIRQTPNLAAIRIMRDCFDMLVIDLYSIRERLTKKDGVFDILKRDPVRLAPTPSRVANAHLAEIVTVQVHEAASRLNGPAPASLETIEALCRRFRADTEALDDDRNRVRAHRYQQRSDTSPLFIALPDLQTQIDVLERYLKDIYLVVTHNGHSMDLADSSSRLAWDMADIIVHGSINGACNYYGVTKVTDENRTPWYWNCRQASLEGS